MNAVLRVAERILDIRNKSESESQCRRFWYGILWVSSRSRNGIPAQRTFSRKFYALPRGFETLFIARPSTCTCKGMYAGSRDSRDSAVSTKVPGHVAGSLPAWQLSSSILEILCDFIKSSTTDLISSPLSTSVTYFFVDTHSISTLSEYALDCTYPPAPSLCKRTRPGT